MYGALILRTQRPFDDIEHDVFPPHLDEEGGEALGATENKDFKSDIKQEPEDDHTSDLDKNESSSSMSK